jgi:hypothetical protein
MKQNYLNALIIIIGICFCIIIFASCTDKSGTTKCLKQNNFKPIKVGGYGWFNGSEEDFYKTNFTAVAPNGDTISGCVTKGSWFKGSTIRLND